VIRLGPGSGDPSLQLRAMLARPQRPPRLPPDADPAPVHGHQKNMDVIFTEVGEKVKNVVFFRCSVGLIQVQLFLICAQNSAYKNN
jgi:hypothetical protein